ncbi:cyclodeaminase/cyclohydrolase family protein [Phosphitispora sp. TUW77]
MSMLDKSCKDFIDVLASKAPVPGGGGAAAFGGVVGMALSNMVGNLTVGKKKYADVEDEVKELIEKGNKVIADLEALVDKDAEVFEPLSKAYGLPKDTPELAQKRDETLENCCKVACSVPMDIMRGVFEGIKLHARMGEIGTMIAISDVACGVVFMKAALIAASMNVIININSIKDEEFNKATKEEMDRLLAEGTKLADDTLALVTKKLA